MKKRERVGETNDVHYFVFNRYLFVCRLTFNYGFDNSR